MKKLTFAFAALTLISTGSASSFTPQPVNPGVFDRSYILEIDANSDQCKAIRAKLDQVQDSRNAYNGNEGNWALKDEIAELDDEIYQLNEELAENNC